MTPASSKKPVRVRFAPSPTGHLHIGGVRSALFNFLFAKHEGGTVILRIEDTDLERSKKEFEKGILDSFHWLGLSYDEGVMPDGSEKGDFGPYRQMARLSSYEKYLTQLLAEHKAYYCFCKKEDLEAQRQSQESQGQAPKYNGKCRSIADEVAQQRIAGGEPAVIRFKLPPEKVTFHDVIRGTVEFDNALTGDIVIAKDIQSPLFAFSNLIDDHEMHITHVIRGEEHLANTPKQVAIARSLGIVSPSFAHLPIILSATGKGKMSKRDGGTTVQEYKDAGYLPEALINFLGLLGWHPVGENELLSVDEMAKEFSLERVQKGGAKFDKEKLDYFNQQYLKRLSVSELLGYLVKGGFIESSWKEEQLLRVIPIVSDRMVRLADFKELAGFFFALPEYDRSMLVWKKSNAQSAKTNLQYCADLLRELPDQLFTKEALEPKLMKVAEQYGKGDVLWPLRVAISGKEASPPPVDIIAALGKHESLLRIDTALAKLSQ